MNFYFGSENVIIGEIREVPEIKSIESEPFSGLKNAFSNIGEAALSATVAFERLVLASLLLGRKVTNNYLKMHGGVLVRKRAFLKAKRRKQ